MHQGSCLCGEIQFKFEQVVGDFVYCHCKSCRKASGAAFGANISVPIEKFEITVGSEVIKVFESSPNKLRHFCGNCGSPLFTKVGENPTIVRVRLGSLDTEFSQQPAAHIFMSHKAHWDQPERSMPSFAEWPSTDVINIYGSHQPTD